MIEINNLTTHQLDEGFLKNIAKEVLRRENKEKTSLSIALVGQVRIRALNKKYRKKNRVTDVLAFPQSKVLLEKFKTASFQKFEGFGEIVICLREVKKNSQRFNTTFKKELARVLIHGILHLLGYDHEKNQAEGEKMRKKEEYYLAMLV